LRRLRAPHFVAEAHRTVVSLRLLVVTADGGWFVDSTRKHLGVVLGRRDVHHDFTC
jgi:hypothetical protein